MTLPTSPPPPPLQTLPVPCALFSLSLKGSSFFCRSVLPGPWPWPPAPHCTHTSWKHLCPWLPGLEGMLPEFPLNSGPPSLSCSRAPRATATHSYSSWSLHLPQRYRARPFQPPPLRGPPRHVRRASLLPWGWGNTNHPLAEFATSVFFLLRVEYFIRTEENINNPLI